MLTRPLPCQINKQTVILEFLYILNKLIKQTDREKHRKEGNVLFNDAFNTFYLQLYGVRHMVKDHPDREKENPLPPHGLLFPINTGCIYKIRERERETEIERV